MIKFYPFSDLYQSVLQKQIQQQNAHRNTVFISLIDLKPQQIFFQNRLFISKENNQNLTEEQIVYCKSQSLVWISDMVIRISQQKQIQIRYLYLPSLNQFSNYVTKQISNKNPLKSEKNYENNQILTKRLSQLSQKYQLMYKLLRCLSSTIIFDFSSKYIRFNHLQQNKKHIQNFIKLTSNKQQLCYSQCFLNQDNIPYYALLKNNSNSLYTSNSIHQYQYQVYQIKLNTSDNNLYTNTNAFVAIRMEIQTNKPGIGIFKNCQLSNKCQNQINTNNHNCYTDSNSHNLLISSQKIINQSLKLLKINKVTQKDSNIISRYQLKQFNKYVDLKILFKLMFINKQTNKTKITNKTQIQSILYEYYFFKQLQKTINQQQTSINQVNKTSLKQFYQTLLLNNQNHLRNHYSQRPISFEIIEILQFTIKKQYQKQLNKESSQIYLIQKQLYQRMNSDIKKYKQNNIIQLTQNECLTKVSQQNDQQRNSIWLNELPTNHLNKCQTQKLTKLLCHIKQKLLSHNLNESQKISNLFIYPLVCSYLEQHLSINKQYLTQSSLKIEQLKDQIDRQNKQIQQKDKKLQYFRDQEEFFRKLMIQLRQKDQQIKDLDRNNKKLKVQIEVNRIQNIGLKQQLQSQRLLRQRIQTQKRAFLQAISTLSKQNQYYIQNQKQLNLTIKQLNQKLLYLPTLQKKSISLTNQNNNLKQQIISMKLFCQQINNNLGLFKLRENDKINFILKQNYQVYQEKLNKYHHIQKLINTLKQKQALAQAEIFRLKEQLRYTAQLHYNHSLINNHQQYKQILIADSAVMKSHQQNIIQPSKSRKISSFVKKVQV